jgi:hypothetical protein
VRAVEERRAGAQLDLWHPREGWTMLQAASQSLLQFKLRDGCGARAMRFIHGVFGVDAQACPWSLGKRIVDGHRGSFAIFTRGTKPRDIAL